MSSRTIAALVLLAAGLAARAGAEESCTTVDGAPAATSESLVLGMRAQIEKHDQAGLQKFLDTGQTLLLKGGHEVDVLQRHPEQGTLLARRPGAGQLSFWTLESGVACVSKDAPKKS